MDAKIIKYEFNDAVVSFEKGDGIMVNATEMAKPFGKTCKDWLKTEQSRRMIAAIGERKKIHSSDLVRVTYGNEGGTWMHEDVALVFAQWLSPDFYVWCNDRIKELLTTGVSTVSDDDAIIANAISILQKRLEESKARQKALEEKVAEDKPKVEYHDQVLTSVSTLTTTQIAKELGMSAIALNRKLHELKVQYKQNGSWVPYAKYQGKGYTESETIKIEGKDGTVATKMVFKWTEAGRKFIHELLNKNK
jgi:phage antirepressor YoqD-like protein